MSTIVATKTFFAQLITVVKNLGDMFPNDPDFPTFHTFLGMLQKTNPSLVINTFYEHVVQKYEKEIDARDEAFVMAYQGQEYDNDMLDIISKVKGYWSVLDGETKDSLWQYMYILKELCKRAHE